MSCGVQYCVVMWYDVVQRDVMMMSFDGDDYDVVHHGVLCDMIIPY